MADGAPGDGAVSQRRVRPARTADRAGALHRGGDVQRQVAPADPFRHLQHEIPIGAQRLDGELAEIAAERGLRRIDEGQKDFGPDVVVLASPRFAVSDTSRGSRRVVK